MRRRFIWLAVVLLPLVTWVAFCCCFCPTGTWFEITCCFGVRTGMTLEEVEGILGPGEPRAWPPWNRNGYSVQGEVFYVWEEEAGDFWIGMRDGRVVDKRFKAPSL